MNKELLQQALDEAKADAIYVFTYAEGISAASKDAIEYMHSWLTVYFDKQALAQQDQPDQQLCSFYQVDSFPALVAAQEQHIQKLQAKLAKPANPFHPLNSRAT